DPFDRRGQSLEKPARAKAGQDRDREAYEDGKARGYAKAIEARNQPHQPLVRRMRDHAMAPGGRLRAEREDEANRRNRSVCRHSMPPDRPRTRTPGETGKDEGGQTR